MGGWEERIEAAGRRLFNVRVQLRGFVISHRRRRQRCALMDVRIRFRKRDVRTPRQAEKKLMNRWLVVIVVIVVHASVVIK